MVYLKQRLQGRRDELIRQESCKTVGPKEWVDADIIDMHEIAKMKPIAKA
jgi:hypothetical protein